MVFDDGLVRARVTLLRPIGGVGSLFPLIALFYLSATVDSAIAYWTGRGGYWKGRIQDER